MHHPLARAFPCRKCLDNRVLCDWTTSKGGGCASCQGANGRCNAAFVRECGVGIAVIDADADETVFTVPGYQTPGVIEKYKRLLSAMIGRTGGSGWNPPPVDLDPIDEAAQELAEDEHQGRLGFEIEPYEFPYRVSGVLRRAAAVPEEVLVRRPATPVRRDAAGPSGTSGGRRVQFPTTRGTPTPSRPRVPPRTPTRPSGTGSNVRGSGSSSRGGGGSPASAQLPSGWTYADAGNTAAEQELQPGADFAEYAILFRPFPTTREGWLRYRGVAEALTNRLPELQLHYRLAAAEVGASTEGLPHVFISYIEPAILDGEFVPGTGRVPPGVTVQYAVGFAVGPMERDEATTARDEALAGEGGAVPPLQQSGGPRLEVDTQDPNRLLVRPSDPAPGEGGAEEEDEEEE